MGKSKQEISKLIAKWWRDAVSSPKFDNGGDPLASMLAGMTVKNYSADILDKFEQNVYEAVLQKLKLYDIITSPSTIDVDYGPDVLLAESARNAGMTDFSNFPWKTVMWYSKHCVSVKAGYTAKVEYLYIDKQYCLDTIENAKYIIEDAKSGNSHQYIKDEKRREIRINECIIEAQQTIDEYEKLIIEAEVCHDCPYVQNVQQ